jgi:deoxyribonuclease-4
MARMNLGGHLSLGRNPAATVRQAAADGFESMQIFASSPGAWKPPIVDRPYAASFKTARDETGLHPLYIHAIYLINLGSDNPELVRRSIGSLKRTLAAGAAMGAAGVITHIGSHGKRGFQTVAGQIGESLAEVLEEIPPETELLLENSAGAGAIVGSTLEEIGILIGAAGNHPQLNVALDTAHLTGSGWDFKDPSESTRLVEEADAAFGLDRLRVIHANDSAVPVGSRRDRHANIGEGHIGDEGFRHLLGRPELRTLPWIMETPDLSDRVEGEPTGSLLRLRRLSGEVLEETVANGP